MMKHQPVLLTEAIEGLAIQSAGVYIDGTFGRGGHTRAILEQLSDQGRVLAMDKDPEAIQSGQAQFGKDARFQMKQASFAKLSEFVEAQGLTGQIQGVLLDLGLSSPQLDDPARGFSFMHDGPLDMRMDPDSGEDAATWLMHVPEQALATVLKAYGEERYARRIARAIVAARMETPIQTTRQLAELIAKTVPSREKHKHPATRSFQAIRIAVNRELEDLKSCLKQCLDVLAIGGRLVVISFHSLEDRIVKQFIREYSKGDRGLPSKLPIKAAAFKPRLQAIGKAIKPSEEEINFNVRARSAVLRIAEKVS